MNPQEIISNLKRLESIIDLESLKMGEIVEIKYLFFPYYLNNNIEVNGMY